MGTVAYAGSEATSYGELARPPIDPLLTWQNRMIVQRRKVPVLEKSYDSELRDKRIIYRHISSAFCRKDAHLPVQVTLHISTKPRLVDREALPEYLQSLENRHKLIESVDQEKSKRTIGWYRPTADAMRLEIQCNPQTNIHGTFASGSLENALQYLLQPKD